MLVLATAILMSSASAVTGYGLGALGALDCPTPFAPAAGAISDEDPILNSRGLVAEGRRRLARLNAVLNEQTQIIARERAGITSALGGPAFNAIDVHYRFSRGPQSYRAECSAPAVAPALPANAALEPPPPGFCVNVGGHVRNYWLDHFAGPRGHVNESICNLRVGFGGPRPPALIGPCVNHLRAFYAAQARQAELQAQLAALNAEIRAYETDRNVLHAQEAEGGICWHCLRIRLGLSVGSGGYGDAPGVGNGLSSIQQLLQFVTGGPRPVRYGGNPMQYPGRPYIVRVPHYYSTHGGQYGGAPGGIGRGSFAGCGGVAGLGLGTNFAPPVAGFANPRAAHPLGAEFDDPLLNPRSANGLFNPGFGAGWAPQVGRGRPAPIVAGLAAGGRPQFGFAPQSPQPLTPEQPYLFANPNTQLGFGDVGAGLVNRPAFPVPPPVIGTGQGVSSGYSLGAVPPRRYAGGAMFPPLWAGPALNTPQIPNGLPTSTLAPPSIIR